MTVVLARRLLVVPTALLLARCGLTPEPYVAPTPAGGVYSPSEAATPEAAAAAEKAHPKRHRWVRMHDATGVSFALPVHREPAVNGISRIYVDDSTPMTYEVQIISATGPADARYAVGHFDQITRSLIAQAGFPDPKATSTGSATDRSIVISAVGTGIQADSLRYMRVRARALGSRVVVVFTVGTGHDGAPLRARVERAHRHLLSTVHWA